MNGRTSICSLHQKIKKKVWKHLLKKESLILQADKECPMYETITYRIENGVAWLTLNRPDKFNAFTSQMNKEIAKGNQKISWL